MYKLDTICRPTRTIQPLSYSIDTNQTSFVGINVVDSVECVNSTYSINFTNTQCRCITYPFNNLTYCPCTSLQTYAPLGPYCQVLGTTFNENGGGYAVFDGEFVFKSFHFRATILDATSTTLNALTWYHIEYQYIDSIILVSINDCQYVTIVNDTLNTYDSSNTFNGCIRNVLSNGYYLDMSKALVSVNSYYGQSSCTLTNPYTTTTRTSITTPTTTAGRGVYFVTFRFIQKLVAVVFIMNLN
ncbi:unnamed protein product [Rotaria sp. Silwood2]|nr:unnamed protein product [Rotaria sp. Silwood2]